MTDGTRLYWIDAGGIRTIPIGGGSITTLFHDSFVGHISLDNSFVYFGEEFLINRIPKIGSPNIATIVSTNGRVSALHVDPNIGWVFWGEKEGGVHAMPTQFGAAVSTFQQPSAGREVTSVGWDGLRVLWSDCLEPGNTNCRIMKHQGGTTLEVIGGVVGVGHLQWDTGSLYWGDTNFLKRFVH